ncbi:hypothetical protein [Photorhabdus noenieputensis]|uniref:hypothetical protein n=1 Tax=Photorhabdus noenieputensis TaxID=1208607 RepID=UPI001BD21FF7|nr:hypothetical protein [Photorhabdus noenieputensis]MCK3667932.1 hypothetical protein [Photorhabdus noenieputensis]
MSADLYIFEASLSDGIDGSLTGVRIVDDVVIMIVLSCGSRQNFCLFFCISEMYIANITCGTYSYVVFL